jgi:hypothetical protein
MVDADQCWVRFGSNVHVIAPNGGWSCTQRPYPLSRRQVWGAERPSWSGNTPFSNQDARRRSAYAAGVRTMPFSNVRITVDATAWRGNLP